MSRSEQHFCPLIRTLVSFAFITIVHAQSERIDAISEDVVSLSDMTYNLRSGIGVKDNVLYSNKDPVSRSYAVMGLDLTAFQIRSDEREFSAFLSADHEQYFESDPVDSESFVLAMIEYRYHLRDNWWIGLGSEYLYIDQLLDLSADDDFNIVQATGHSFGVLPSIEKKLAGDWIVSLDVPWRRQYYKDPLDDYTEAAPELMLSYKTGQYSQLRLKANLEYRGYDSRTIHGALSPHQSSDILNFERLGFDLRYRHYLDHSRKWRSTTVLGFLNNKDNGDGYYNYDRFTAKQELLYKANSLQIRSGIGLSNYHYANQKDDEQNQLRRKRVVRAEIRASYDVRDSLKVFSAYSFERSLSNSSYDNYRANNVSFGMEWEF